VAHHNCTPKINQNEALRPVLFISVDNRSTSVYANETDVNWGESKTWDCQGEV